MSASVINLDVLGRSSILRELDLVSELFHRINRIIPENQKLLIFSPQQRVCDAVGAMRRCGYSQVPVVENGEVLGVFSYRSFAKEVASLSFSEFKTQGCAPGELTVDDFLEKFDFASVTEDMNRVFDSMDRDNGVLIGSPDRLIGILAPMDLLRYLYKVANPFVMISEIELAIRAIIRLCLDDVQLAYAARRTLSSVYRSEKDIPESLEEMTFDNYRSLISFGEMWPNFAPKLGGNKTRVNAKLLEISKLRNDLLHFKREITVLDHEILSTHRDWFLSKIKQAGNSRAEGD